MTEEELTELEHRPDVIKVLTSYEMGDWLHRRDKRLLQEIRTEIKSLQNANPSYWYSGDMVDREEVLDIIDKYKAEGEENNV